MRPNSGRVVVAIRYCRTAVLGLTLCSAAGCNTTGAIVGGVIGGTLLGAQSPGQELEQVYYLGVFDPQEQVQPQVYRVTVRGQASAISNMKFGSGWVPSSVIDSLETRVSFAAGSDRPTVETGEARDKGKDPSGFKTGRRLMLFGPEGFREAPKDHRLVIVMGASPEKFFAAIDSSLQIISRVQRDQIDPGITKQLVAERERIRSEQRILAALKTDVTNDLADAK